MKLKPWLRITLSILLSIGIGIIDYHLPVEANTTLFYYIPIIMLAFGEHLSLRVLISFAMFSAVVWGIVDNATHIYTAGNYLLYNTISRAFTFAIAGVVVNRFFVEKKLRRTIAEQKRLQEESNHQLKLVNEELNRFVGMAAHDIRNPVGAIQMMSETLMEDTSINEECREYLGMIRDTAANSLLILNDTLNISQIQSGTITLKLVDTDYIALVRDSIRQNEPLAVKKKQTIRFDPAVTFAYISFDKNRLLQVLNNLLTNAIKYSESNTTITIHIAYTDDDQKFIKTTIIDQGLGIEEKFHATLFDPFITTDNKPTDNESKTGLGLAIVKKILELHQGTIGFTSEAGKGSTFFFVIPVGQGKTMVVN
jgi:signal transduction histidine kinase